MNKKVMQINSVVNWGSTGKIVEGIAQSAIAQGWKSYIAYGRSYGYETDSSSELIRIGNDFDIKLHGLLTRITDRHGLGSSNPTKLLIKRIEEISPDIIHLHNIHGYYLNIELLFNYLVESNIQVIWTLHDCWSMTGHCSYFDFIKCDKWMKLCYSCPQKRNYPQSLFMDRSLENFKLKKKLFTSPERMIIVPVSNWLGRLVGNSYLGKYSIEVIHNGINIDIFTNENSTHLDVCAKYAIPEDKFIILGVANIWEDRKGLKDFLELSKIINADTLIVLVGLTAAQKRTLPCNVIGIERTQSIEELASLYRSADLFANLTWEDNFPTTNLEALACGCPVLTYDTGGSIEAITKQTGFILPQGDINGILHIVEQVRQQGRDYYKNNCRNHAVKYYNKNSQFNNYIELYNQCLKTKFF